jgi:hypothetical protein
MAGGMRGGALLGATGQAMGELVSYSSSTSSNSSSSTSYYPTGIYTTSAIRYTIAEEWKTTGTATFEWSPGVGYGNGFCSPSTSGFDSPSGISIRELSPVERKANLEKKKQFEKDQRVQRLKFLRAERKAQALLKEIVSEIDFRDYKQKGYLEVKLCSGKIVRIGRYANDLVFDAKKRKFLPDGKIEDHQIASLCIHGGDHIDSAIPPTDRVITKFLLAKNNESEFFKRAHVSIFSNDIQTDPKTRIDFNKTLNAPGGPFFATAPFLQWETSVPNQIMQDAERIAVATPVDLETEQIKKEYPLEFEHAKEAIQKKVKKNGPKDCRYRVAVIPRIEVIDLIQY